MGFYIRKGFNFGPLRLNLSRSGLGASFGVKGARIGMGPRGTYVHVGRGGFYYRQTLTPTSRNQARQAPSPPSSIPSPPPHANDMQQIASSAAVTMVDSSATDLLYELNRVKRRRQLFPIILVVGLLVLGWLGLTDANPWIFLISLVVTVACSVYARHVDVSQGTAILNYSLDSDAPQQFVNLQLPFRQLSASALVWHIDAAERNVDAKRNAGAGTNLKRTEIRPSFSRPPRVQCNLEVPTLVTGRTTLYFFPDRLLVYDAAGVGAVAYKDLKVDVQESRFVEHGKVPKDSHQVGTTWQYVNKKGGPDRRFSRNRQIPIMQYGVIAFSSDSGLSVLLMCSRPDVAQHFKGFAERLQESPAAHQDLREGTFQQLQEA
jgi:hypothetical protein